MNLSFRPNLRVSKEFSSWEKEVLRDCWRVSWELRLFWRNKLNFLSVSSLSLYEMSFKELYNTSEKREFLKSWEFTSVNKPRVRFLRPEYDKPTYKAPLRSNQLLSPLWVLLKATVKSFLQYSAWKCFSVVPCVMLLRPYFK